MKGSLITKGLLILLGLALAVSLVFHWASRLRQGANPVGRPETSQAAKKSQAAMQITYLGQGSLRIQTPEGKIIYINPYSGRDEDYSLPADLVLITHDHYDHTATNRIQKIREEAQVLSQAEALQASQHQTFELPFVTIEAVEAGNNRMHSIENCVGYLLTFTNGQTVYVSGDTSRTEQMAQLAERNIDYAFWCCDGVFNMDAQEASECAALVGARHNIPYHTATTDDEDHFDRQVAEGFQAPGRIIMEPGQALTVN